VVAAVLVHHTSLVGGLPLPTLHGYLMAFGIAGVIALVASAAALTIPGDPTSDDTRLARKPAEGARDEALEGA
jgi:hypothetical protein